MAGLDADVSAFGIADQNADFGTADKSRFADETAVLLHRRLTAVATVLAVVFAAAFVGNWFAGNAPAVGVRVLILIALVVSVSVLRSRISLTLLQLRVFELSIFGAIATQVLLTMCLRLSFFANESQGASAVAVHYLYTAVWCTLLLTYGIFMPNTWKRAAVILFPAAGLFYVVAFALQASSPAVATALERSEFKSPVPLPVIAALVAVYGTHIINSVRQQAFKARQFGQYHLGKQLGAGGMGEVYEAEHRMLKRPCAIKLIRSESEADAKAIARFEQEVRSIARLSHWNTVEVFDYGRTDDGAFYYVMELLPGLSLEELVGRHGPLAPQRAIHFLRQTCRALQEAHAVGLIHRDIKPANIFAASRGGVFDVAKLLDFGLVRQTDSDVSDNNSKSGGGFSGSPAYMAPEQAADYANAGEASDIYALGGVAYYLLTGQPPFSGNAFEVLIAHARREPTPLSESVTSIPADLEQVVLRCLAKSPDERYPDARSLEQALAACECADAWTDEDAAEWWLTAEQQPRSDSTPSTEPRTAVIDQTIDITGDA